MESLVSVDEIKFVVAQLNSLLNKKLNVISYDNLRSEQRVEILVQVFREIDPSMSPFETAADPEDVVVRILDLLRIYKYHPPDILPSNDFRQKVISSDKDVLTHILHYLLSKREDLVKRAYLSRFLLRIEVSPEVEGDNDIVQLYQQYERLMEDFKTTHATHDSQVRELTSVKEVQADIKAMQEEKESIMSKLSSLKRKVDTSTNSNLFHLVTLYREERDRHEKMTQQADQQDKQMSILRLRIHELEEALKDSQMNQLEATSTIDDVFNYLADEINAKKSLVDDILPREYQLVIRHVQSLQEVQSTNLTSEYLDRLHSRLETLSKEVDKVMEEKASAVDRMTGQVSVDDKILLFRKTSQELNDKKVGLKDDLHRLEKEETELRRKLQEKRHKFDGQVILRGDNLKNYMSKMKEKQTEYKKNKSELTELRTEKGIMIRTMDVLKSREQDIQDILDRTEQEKGISGYFAMKEDERMTADAKNVASEEDETPTDLTAQFAQLSEEIASRKAALAPFVKELRPLRAKVHDLQAEYDQKKTIYDSTAAGLEAALTKTTKEVNRLKAEVESVTEKMTKAKSDLEKEEKMAEIVREEDEGQTSHSTKLRGDLERESDNQRRLKEKEGQLMEEEDFVRHQKKLWTDLQVLLEVKNRSLTRSRQERQEMRKMSTLRDHLVL